MQHTRGPNEATRYGSQCRPHEIDARAGLINLKWTRGHTRRCREEAQEIRAFRKMAECELAVLCDRSLEQLTERNARKNGLLL